MYLKLGLITLSSLLLFNGCSTKEVDKKEDILFKIQTTNKNLKPINYELNISNIGYGECMDFNKMDSGLLRKKEGTKITVSENKRKKEILVEIEMKNKEKSQFTIKEENMTQEEKFKAVLESMKELQTQASMVLNAQMINTEPKRKM